MNFSISIFNKSYTYKSFVKASVLTILIIVNSIALLNYILDPLRMFQHKHTFIQKQLDFNEREQKTNYLKFVATPQNIHFDSILLGSSRTTYINQNSFKDLQVFNYAANNMFPYEYEKFIYYFTKITGNSPKNIILGVDFFGTNLERNKNYSRENFLEQTNSTNRWGKLYNIKAAEYSIRNLKQYFKLTKPYYNRDNIKNVPDTNHFKPKTSEELDKNLRQFKYYKFDNTLKDYYSKLKNEYSDSKFIIFTTPVSINQIKSYQNNNYLEYYFNWLRELVDVFGEINHFMYPNTITKNLNNFFDAEHMLPATGDRIAEYISNKKSLEDFGVTLTKENIEKFIKEYPNQ